MIDKILASRIRILKENNVHHGPVIYWMNRDQRIVDNWAYIIALELAKERNETVIVLFNLAPSFGALTYSQQNKIYQFMGAGLKELIVQAEQNGVHLVIEQGEPRLTIPRIIKKYQAGLLIADYSPLHEMRKWRQDVIDNIEITMLEVDAHNIIPVWIASDKQEWGAYTLRPKITRLLQSYLIDFPNLTKEKPAQILIHSQIKAWLSQLKNQPSSDEAMQEFITTRLPDYHFRNNPNLNVTSRLSAYLHFGHLSAQRLALATKMSGHPSEEFLEELIVRRELAENYCHYNPQYDTVDGFPNWAKATLAKHQHDKREYIYTSAQLEFAKTHDPIWNAAQRQLLTTNYMHGYMRMYWAKKILEWTASVNDAFRIAVYINDKYQLDGRDPNGYTGIAWALGGVHDRPWGERSIFGMIRYMNMAGLKRKFGTDEYIDTWGDDTPKLL